MNHGRSNTPINYCPECGQRFQSSATGSCSAHKHMDLRRQRLSYCTDCGCKLGEGALNGKR